MKKRYLVSMLVVVLLTVFLTACASTPNVTVAPLREPEDLSQVLADYHAILDEAISSDDLTAVGFGKHYAYDSVADTLLAKFKNLELEPVCVDPIPQDEGYDITLRYSGGWIRLGVLNEEQIDIYYYNTREDDGVARYQLKICNREQGKELCGIAENFTEWKKSLPQDE